MPREYSQSTLQDYPQSTRGEYPASTLRVPPAGLQALLAREVKALPAPHKEVRPPRVLTEYPRSTLQYP